ncbi:MAG: hypothetical protein QOF68_3071 [Gaiellales bacterium]|jgi:hypothetical protein|nr:hypothetical protein [Gaiellales bacterium]
MIVLRIEHGALAAVPFPQLGRLWETAYQAVSDLRRLMDAVNAEVLRRRGAQVVLAARWPS